MGVAGDKELSFVQKLAHDFKIAPVVMTFGIVLVIAVALLLISAVWFIVVADVSALGKVAMTGALLLVVAMILANVAD